jgi:hypothetical protein
MIEYMGWDEAFKLALFPATVAAVYFYFMWLDLEKAKEKKDE